MFRVLIILAITQLIKCSTDYCIIGAGPSGLQLGYFLEKAGRDYEIFEKCDVVGCFFRTYPRHRTLISINKRYTGHQNKGFNERHDWNSLLSDNDTLKFTRYSDEFFPPADVMLDYLNDFKLYNNISVTLNTQVQSVSRSECGNKFVLKVANVKTHVSHERECSNLIMAGGVPTPRNAFWFNDDVLQYADMPMDKSFYENKRVLILGSGNSGWETANYLQGTAAYIHILSKSAETRIAYQTHYVGDVRAINIPFIDTYQLKSLNGITNNFNVDEKSMVQDKDGRWVRGEPLEAARCLSSTSARVNPQHNEQQQNRDRFVDEMNEVLGYEKYDLIISCLGFKMDKSFFDNSATPQMDESSRQKFPRVNADFESSNVKNLFFIGTLSHVMDRNSSGGFIHGFRYTTKVLFNILQQRNHGVQWPHSVQSREMLALHVLKRINTNAAGYQMFHYLCDVIVQIPSDGNGEEWKYMYFNDYPMRLLHQFEQITGVKNVSQARTMIWYFDYGDNFSCVGCNTLREDRFKVDPENPLEANFIHPIFLQWDKGENMGRKMADNKYALTENFNTEWYAKLMFADYLFHYLTQTWHFSGPEYRVDCFVAVLEYLPIPQDCHPVYTHLNSIQE